MALLESTAVSILTRAVKFDNEKRFTEALVCYQEGLQILMTSIKSITCDVKRRRLREKVESYMERAEKLKAYIEQEKDKGSYHEQIVIEDDSTGHSYRNLIGRFLDASVTEVLVEDPYVRISHQCENLVKLCEVLVKSCNNLKIIHLLTSKDVNAKDQEKFLEITKQSLKKYNIALTYEFSDNLHDRQIRLSNGWVIKIGRGLDYFKAPEGRFCVGFFDMDLRPCKSTVVDIFHEKNVQIRYG